MASPDAVTAARAVVIIYRHMEQAARGSDLSMAQYRLLLFLKDAPQRVGLLAEVSSLSKATISLAVNAVRERGWVSTSSDGDGRSTVVSLTPAGQARLEAFEVELAAAIGQALRPEDMAAFAASVEASARAIGAHKKSKAQRD